MRENQAKAKNLLPTLLFVKEFSLTTVINYWVFFVSLEKVWGTWDDGIEERACFCWEKRGQINVWAVSFVEFGNDY